MIIENSQATVEVSIKDELTFETYIGIFKFKGFLTPIDTIKADRIYRELIGSVSPNLASISAQNMAFSISQLSVRTVEAPHWFDLKSELPGGRLAENVLTELLSLSIEAEEKYREQQKAKFVEIQKRLQTKFENSTIKKRADDVTEEDEDKAEDGEPEEIDLESEE
jgi:hypothetical protein